MRARCACVHVAVQGTSRAAVRYDFAAEADGELSVMAGDEVMVWPEEDGWCQAVHIASGRCGTVRACLHACLRVLRPRT